MEYTADARIVNLLNEARRGVGARIIDQDQLEAAGESIQRANNLFRQWDHVLLLVKGRNDDGKVRNGDI